VVRPDCALRGTKSNDLATFPVFGRFISKLAERKPEVADRFLAKASDDLRNFLAGFLNGLALSSRRDIYERILESELDSARSLAGIAHHLRYSDVKKLDFAARLLKRAIDKGDPVAVVDCLLFALEHYGTEKIADPDTFVLSLAFPSCTQESATALADLVKAARDTEADFVLAILQDYNGETSTYVVLKEIVSRFPDDFNKMSRVRIALDNTGVVSGEFGFAEACRAKKESLTAWLADQRPAVKAFDSKHIAELDRIIASEQRRAEAEREMRNRSDDEEDDELDHHNSGRGESAG
jgi:hypothetical protein